MMIKIEDLKNKIILGDCLKEMKSIPDISKELYVIGEGPCVTGVSGVYSTVYNDYTTVIDKAKIETREVTVYKLVPVAKVTSERKVTKIYDKKK